MGLALFLLTLIVGNLALPESKRLTVGMVGHDFLAFYTAGHFLREGRPGDLYDLNRVREFQHALAAREGLAIGESYGPFWNPPFYANVFRPLATLPYRTALLVWGGVNLTCLALAIGLLVRLLPVETSWKTWCLIPLLLCTSMPFIQALTHGQNTPVSLLVLCTVVTCWVAGRAVVTGLIAGLLFYKPQLGLVVAVAVVLTLGWRAVLGLAVTGVALLLITLVTLPGSLGDYLHRMPGNLQQFQVVQPYHWDRHVTFRAFWRLLFQGREPGELTTLTKVCWLASCAGLTTLLGWAWWRCRGTSDRSPLIAASVASMPLLMPFYFDYDLLLLAVGVVLFAANRQRTDRALTLGWVVLYAWLMINSPVARLTGVNGTVVLLAGVAILSARRAAVRPRVNVPLVETPTPPLAAAA